MQYLNLLRVRYHEDLKSMQNIFSENVIQMKFFVGKAIRLRFITNAQDAFDRMNEQYILTCFPDHVS